MGNGKRKNLFLASMTFLLVAGCGNQNPAGATGAKGSGDASLQKTLSEPAPAGSVGLATQVLAEGLSNPWSISFFPDDLILVTERAGSIRAIRNGVLQDAPIAGGPQVFAQGQGGLFDILLHPNYAQNSVIYISYAGGDASSNGLKVARGKFDGSVITDLEEIYSATPDKDTTLHFGGRMDWGSDGKLYVTIGEGSWYKEEAQDMSSSFGSVIRLNEDGTAAPGNPDFGSSSPAELYTKGHRNPQGLAVDHERDVIWTHEHGPRGGDEINIIEAGQNYGWPFASYGIDYNGARITPFTQYEDTVQPFKYWTPSIAPSGLAVYRGDLFPEWDGDLLIGAMAGQALHHVAIEDMREASEERYLIGERIRDVRVGPDGAIYVTTEERRGAPVGQVLRITPAP